MFAGIVPASLLNDSSHSLIEETLPKPLRLAVLVREECDLDNCIDAVTWWVIDSAFVARISSRFIVAEILGRYRLERAHPGVLTARPDQ